MTTIEIDQINQEIDQLSIDELENIYARYAGFESQPVDIKTFITDPYYLGRYFADDNGKVKFYDYWYNVLQEIYPSPFFSPYWLIGLRGSIGRGKCCCADTLIPTNLGIITIEEIYQKFKDGYEILVLSQSGSRRVVDAIDSGTINGVKYTTTTGVYGIVGLDHKFKCVNNDGIIQWKPAFRLKVGDRIVRANLEHPAPSDRDDLTRETVNPLLEDLLSRKHLPEEIMKGSIQTKRSFVRRAFDVHELARGYGASITFDYRTAAWEFYMVVVSIGIRVFMYEKTIVVPNTDVDRIMHGCSRGANYVNGPQDLNKFLANSNGDMVAITQVSNVRARMYDISVEGSPTYTIGGLISHNTMAACTGLAYDLHLLQSMKSPQSNFNLLQSDKIIFAIMNVTLSLTKDVVWDRLSGMFSGSPYFSALLEYARNASKARGKLIKDESYSMFPKKIDFFSGSRITHTLGKAILHCVFSEANFEVMNDQVYDGFNSVVARQESRFLDEQGKVPGKIWIDSSEGDKFSAINRIMDKYKGAAGVYVDQGPIWQVKHWLYKDQPRFPVFIGTEYRKPDFLESNDPAIENEPENVLWVPEFHMPRFTADLEQALRDLGGISTASSYLLFRDKKSLTASMIYTPVFPDTFSIDFADPEDQIYKYMQFENYFKINEYRNIPRNIHIDIGLTGDRLGIASTVLTGFVETETVPDPETSQVFRDSVPTTVTEFAFGLEAKQGQQIPIYKIRQFIMWMASCGSSIGMVTADGYQSADCLQLLKLAGIPTETVSLDRTSDPYVQFRNSIYEGRSILPQNKILEKELSHLEVSPDGKKVDHPKEFTDGTRASKDIADGVAGSVVTCIKNSGQFRNSYVDWKLEIDETKENLIQNFWPGK